MPTPNPIKGAENFAYCGILPVNKAAGSTSFHLVSILRKRTRIEKIGHAGTLDPFATGVMVMLIGRHYTRLSDQFLSADKEYRARVKFGLATDTYDIDGKVLSESDLIPSSLELEQALSSFQGNCSQIPPMFSAKKVKGQKLYDLARKGIVLEREPINVKLSTTLLHYEYPYAELNIACSKGTYIRTLAHDLGQMLGCGAHLSALSRTKSGSFTLQDCVDQSSLLDSSLDFTSFLRLS